ncbi:MAG: crotonase/enoyl-CoA hydratase family protein [Baekduia sp.]
MAESPVLIERRGASLLVTINRPDQRNAVNRATADALEQAFHEFEADKKARVMVLTGAGGRAFCAGADLNAPGGLIERDNEGGSPLGFTRLTPSKPTIAAVRGYAVAGGLELALWCDLRIAADDATFGCFERRWGVPLIDGGTQRLPRVVGQGRALDLVLTGRPVDATEALAIGLATEVVAAGTEVDRALELAERIAAFPWPTVLSDRRALIEGSGLPLDRGLEIERDAGREVLLTAAAGAKRFAGGAGRRGSFDAV